MTEPLEGWLNVSRSPDGRIYWAVYRRAPTLLRRRPALVVLAGSAEEARAAVVAQRPDVDAELLVLRRANRVEVGIALRRPALSSGLDLIEG